VFAMLEKHVLHTLFKNKNQSFYLSMFQPGNVIFKSCFYSEIAKVLAHNSNAALKYIFWKTSLR
jgi:hypothetical protein